MNRRAFLSTAALPMIASAPAKWRISLAEPSLRRSGVSTLELPRIAREQFSIDGVEFTTASWPSPAPDFVRQLSANLRRYRVAGVVLMCDGAGLMGHSDRATRMKAAESHRHWLHVARDLGCHSIRTNMYADSHPSTPAEIDAFLSRCGESFSNLCGYARALNLNVLVENHGGISSDPDVLVRFVKQLDMDNLGTLPDFGNFPKGVDRYEAVAKLMPFARHVTFKCYDFSAGKETTIDMDRMMKIVRDAGYRGWIGIEYEGNRMTDAEGIRAARSYLERGSIL